MKVPRANVSHADCAGPQALGPPLLVIMEGWDAAGKGGAIRRLTEALDARLYRVIPISAPTEEELALLPKEVPPGAGVYVERNDAADRLVIFESVMRRFYWSSEAIALALPPGDFEVWIWSPQKTTGDFVFGFGVEEDFSNGFGEVFEDWGTYAY